MELKDYDAEGYAEDKELEADHPGVLLRQRLSEVEAPADSSALSELLYTVNETGLLTDVELTSEDALTVWRVVELSRQLSPEDVEAMRL